MGKGAQVTRAVTNSIEANKYVVRWLVLVHGQPIVEEIIGPFSEKQFAVDLVRDIKNSVKDYIDVGMYSEEDGILVLNNFKNMNETYHVMPLRSSLRGVIFR